MRKGYVLKHEVLEMIKVINLSNRRQELFKSYHDLCDYINRIERFKTLDSGKDRWGFIRRKYETLSFVYHRFPKSFEKVLTPQEKKAFENGLGLIEIMSGDEENTTQILFTPNLDITSLKRNWCHDYCLAHGYTVSEMENS